LDALEATYRQARHANRSGGLVQFAGDLGLAAAFCFWAWVLWGFVKPSFTSPQNTATLESLVTGGFLAAFALILALCCAVVMPALCAAIFPHTAAAQYLQEVRRSAWGFWLLGGSCLLLVGFTLYILVNWWRGRVGVIDPATGPITADEMLVYALTAMTTIFFVVVPAWSSNYGTPIIWLTEVQQSHQVERLKMTHKQDIALAKASYRRALNILKAGLDSATAEQREYVAGMLIGLHEAERALMLDIADTLDEDARLEHALPSYNDPLVTQRYGEIRAALVNGTPVLRGEVVDENQAPEALIPRSAPRRPAAGRRGAPRYAEEYESAFEALQPFVTARKLATHLGVEERTARDVLAEWEEDGVITKGNIRGQWRWTEREVA